jgi:hypothetical protein
MENIFLNEELVLSAIFIKHLPNGKLFYCQDKLVYTNSTNHILDSLDVIDFIEHTQ